MELDKIYNMDCLIGMQEIPSGSVDAIICDLPYGTMKGVGKGTQYEGKNEWDEIIPSEHLFEQYERVLRRNGVAILFSQEPYTSHLRTFKPRNMEFIYPMIWEKDQHGNVLIVDKAPLNYFEDINVFVKLHDTQLLHPLRDYFTQVADYCGGKRNVISRIGGRADHTFRSGSSQFSLCTAETYGLLISEFHIDKMQGFRTFESLQEENSKFGFNRTFNIPKGKAFKSNILKYAKDTDGFHPTQKPVALIADLIRTYSNEGDTILDNCMGSGTTAVACIKEKRHFIGFELNKDYYDKACQRIDAEKRQLTLF